VDKNVYHYFPSQALDSVVTKVSQTMCAAHTQIFLLSYFEFRKNRASQ